MRVLAAILALLVMLASASAQTPDPVHEHYRAYNEALAAGDLERAETEAAAALAASVERNGEGGRTGVLAINLAILRLGLQHAPEARAPAAEALAIAEARGSDSGLDLLMARLVDAQARLGEGDDQGARAEQLRAILEQARARHDLDEQTLSASMALGAWGMSNNHPEQAAAAYDIAASISGAEDTEAPTLAAAAKIARAAQLLNPSAAGRPRREAVAQARELLADALNVLCRLVLAENARGDPTPLQIAFAKGMAWNTVAWFNASRAERAAARPDGQADETDDGPASLLGPNICRMTINSSGSDFSRFYPGGALSGAQQGVVVLRILVEADGSVSRTDVVASAPAELFSGSASRLVQQVGVRRARDAPENCTMEQVKFMSVVFRID